MTVSTQEAAVFRVGDGATTVFTFSFEARSTTSIKVDNIISDVRVPSAALYSVTLNPSGVGGQITFATAPANLLNFLIYRETEVTQLVSVRSQTKYDPKVVEDVWDKLTFIAQEQKLAGADIRFGRDDFQTRAALVTAVSEGFTLPDGLVVFAGGLGYRFETGATAISDLPGLALNPIQQTTDRATLAIDPGPFGGNFLSALSVAKIEMNTPDNTDTPPRFGLSLTAAIEGGHPNGPGSARAPLWVMAEKNNARTTTKTGEIDGIYIVVDQGAKDDVGGILIGASKTFGSGGDTGGLVGIELSARRVNPAGATTDHVQAIMGFQEGLGGFNEGNGCGFYAEAQVGTPRTAFAGIGRSDLAGAPNFTNLIAGATSRSPASLYYRVTGSGVTYGANGTAALPAYSFVSTADLGMYRVNATTLGWSTQGTARVFLSSAGLVPATNAVLGLGASTVRFTSIWGLEVNLGTTSTNGAILTHGTGSPEGVRTANVGSIYMRLDGGAGTAVYFKESGTGNTGWVAK